MTERQPIGEQETRSRGSATLVVYKVLTATSDSRAYMNLKSNSQDDHKRLVTLAAKPRTVSFWRKVIQQEVQDSGREFFQNDRMNFPGAALVLTGTKSEPGP